MSQILMGRDLKEHLQLSSSRIFNMLRFSSRIYVLPSVIFLPTNMCNYDCYMCSFAKSNARKPENIDFCMMEKALVDCSKFRFKPLVHFSGHGEPLVYPYIRDAIRLCGEKELRWSMTTNGLLLDGHIDDIVLNRCIAINISIHGERAEHDRISGVSGSLDRVVESITKLSDAKKRMKSKTPIVAINCVITNENVRSLKKILGTCSRLPIESVTFQHTIFSQRDIKKRVGFLIRDEEKLDQLIRFVTFLRDPSLPVKTYTYPKIRRDDMIGYYTDKDYRFNESCVFPWISACIYPNLDVKLCNQVIGNIETDSLKSIINSEEAIKFRDCVRKGRFDILPNPPNCFRCCHRHYY